MSHGGLKRRFSHRAGPTAGDMSASRGWQPFTTSSAYPAVVDMACLTALDRAHTAVRHRIALLPLHSSLSRPYAARRQFGGTIRLAAGCTTPVSAGTSRQGWRA